MAAQEARKKGIKAGVLQLKTVWPFADQEIAQYAGQVKKIIVPELNYSGQIAGEVRKLFDLSIPVIGVNVCGGVGITPQQIMQAIE